MSDSSIQLPADGPGKRLDTEALTVGSDTVHRERNQVAGAAADDIAVVTDAEPGASDHGLVVREAARGQASMSASIPVAIASDQSALEVSDGGGSLTVDGTVAISGTVTVDGSGVTQPISAASLHLPSGAATATKQDSQISALGATTDAEASGDGSIIALLKRLRALLASPLTIAGTVT